MPAGVPHAATSTVDLETGPPIGQPVNDDYVSTASVFWQRSDPGFRPYRRGVDGPGACEFVVPGTVARLTRPAAGVTLYAGLFSTASGSVSATLTAYNAAGAPVGSATTPIGVGITTPITVTSVAADITRFEVVAEGPGKVGAELGFDDLAIQFPDSPQPRGCFGALPV